MSARENSFALAHASDSLSFVVVFGFLNVVFGHPAELIVDLREPPIAPDGLLQHDHLVVQVERQFIARRSVQIELGIEIVQSATSVGGESQRRLKSIIQGGTETYDKELDSSMLSNFIWPRFVERKITLFS